MAKEKTHKPGVVVPTDKLKAAEQAAADLRKAYGDAIVMQMGNRPRIKHPCIPTRIYQLDNYGIQAGGFPRGRIVEVYGPESGGKTTLALQVIAEVQRQGELAAFVDVEHALDPVHASRLGVDVGSLFISQPDNGESALEVAESLVRSGGFGIVVIDSVAALVPQAELDGEMGDSHMGLQARLMSQACRKLTGVTSKSGTCVVFINQIRDKIGVMFGSPETTAGGRALKFYASLRLDIRRISQIKDGDRVVGAKTKIKVAKNKVGCPFREVETDLMYDEESNVWGFNAVGSVVDAGVLNGAIEKAGAWYAFKGERLGQGRDAVCGMLRGNDEWFQKVYAEVRKADETPTEA